MPTRTVALLRKAFHHAGEVSRNAGNAPRRSPLLVLALEGPRRGWRPRVMAGETCRKNAHARSPSGRTSSRARSAGSCTVIIIVAFQIAPSEQGVCRRRVARRILWLRVEGLSIRSTSWIVGIVTSSSKISVTCSPRGRASGSSCARAPRREIHCACVPYVPSVNRCRGRSRDRQLSGGQSIRDRTRVNGGRRLALWRLVVRRETSMPWAMMMTASGQSELSSQARDSAI